MSLFFFHPPNLSKKAQKSPSAQQDQSGGGCEIWQYINEFVISCACVALCRAGAFVFYQDNFGPCWPEVIPRCRSPPPSFRLPVNLNTRNGGIYESYQSAGYLPSLYTGLFC